MFLLKLDGSCIGWIGEWRGKKKVDSIYIQDLP